MAITLFLDKHMNESRILALDVGDRRIGMAISSPEGGFALPLQTIVRDSKQQEYGTLRKIIQQKQITTLVVGLPVSLNGQYGPQVDKVEAFIEELVKGLDVTVEWMDERYTSVIAQQNIRACGKQPFRQKSLIDQEAARTLLQDYIRQVQLQQSSHLDDYPSE
jgi:putative Holliday junction resolvase